MRFSLVRTGAAGPSAGRGEACAEPWGPGGRKCSAGWSRWLVGLVPPGWTGRPGDLRRELLPGAVPGLSHPITRLPEPLPGFVPSGSLTFSPEASEDRICHILSRWPSGSTFGLIPSRLLSAGRACDLLSNPSPLGRAPLSPQGPRSCPCPVPGTAAFSLSESRVTVRAQWTADLSPWESHSTAERCGEIAVPEAIGTAFS